MWQEIRRQGSSPIDTARQNAAPFNFTVKFSVSLLVISRWPNYAASVLAAPVLRTIVQYLIAFCSRPETASDIISGRLVGPIVHDKHVNFLSIAKTVIEKFHMKPSGAAFSTVFRTSITSDSDRKKQVMSYPVVYRPDRYGCTRKTWWFSVIPFSRYTTASLCDGRTTTNERRRPTDPLVIGQSAWWRLA